MKERANQVQRPRPTAKMNRWTGTRRQTVHRSTKALRTPSRNADQAKPAENGEQQDVHDACGAEKPVKPEAMGIPK